MEIKGRNLVDGLPKNMMLHPDEVREALADSVMSVLDAIRTTLERTPPELSADIIDHGITLTGGGCTAAWTGPADFQGNRYAGTGCGESTGLCCSRHR